MQKLTFSFLVTILILCYSCQPNQQKPDTIEGIWESIGYGKILKIDATHYEYYDITDISCLPSKKGAISDVKDSMEVSNDTLAVKRGYSMYYYSRINELPNACLQSIENKNDLLYNFEVFATTYKNHYAYLELNNVNWDSLYNASKEKINTNTTAVELYSIMQDMIDHVKDNHGSIEPTEEIYELADEQNSLDEEGTAQREYGDFEIAGLVAKHHLTENLTKDSWLLSWGKMEDTIGYIQVNAMWLFADLTLNDSLVKENGFVSSYIDAFDQLAYDEQKNVEVKGISALMDTVMHDLWNTEVMVIDVRFNGGGQDEVGLEILRRFNSERRQVASKKARTKNGYTQNTPIYLEPAINPYTKPVYVLTSQQSASATDMMALSSMELPQLKRIGSHTDGAISDALQKTLPNGWYFSLSNEVYMDTNGKCYENIGVPVDYELNYTPERQPFFKSVTAYLEKDKQAILNAINELQGR